MERRNPGSSMSATKSLSEKRKQLEGLRAGITAVDTGLLEVQAKIDCLYKRKQTLQQEKSKLEVEAKHLEQACSQPDVNLKRSDFKWSERLHKLKTSKFGIKIFRPYQEEVINATMSGRDVILVMPTGGGKSLCFQLPALLTDGFTLVVSPLVSLMEDQTMFLQSAGIAATLLSASTSKDHVKTVHRDMCESTDNLKLLYVTPEKIVKSKRFMAVLQKAYEKGRLSRIAIDEVHCCSQWGHDFRPDYKVLGILKRQFTCSPILGLTATASSSVLEDVKSILNIPGCDVFRASYNRANLYYEVRPKPAGKDFVNTLEKMLKGEFANQSGIIYCFSRKDTENLARDLMGRGIQAAAYHAYIDPQYRSQTHRNWKNGHIQVVIATTAFGMGIDKPDVRFVIHHSLSKSMENYYQESGRAGRDDQPARCILFFGFVDVFRQSSMVVMEQTGLTKLYQMVAYCISVGRCRRSLLGEHFDETWEGDVECDQMCDACKNDSSVEDKDVTDIAKRILHMLRESGAHDQRLTGLKLVDNLGKAHNQRASEKLSRFDYGHIILNLLLEGYLKVDFHFNSYSTISYICAGPKADHAHSGSKVTVSMRSPNGQCNKGGKERNKAKGQKRSRQPVSKKDESKKDEIIVLDDDDCDDDAVSGSDGNRHNSTKVDVAQKIGKHPSQRGPEPGERDSTVHGSDISDDDSDIFVINTGNCKKDSINLHNQTEAASMKATKNGQRSKVTARVGKGKPDTEEANLLTDDSPPKLKRKSKAKQNDDNKKSVMCKTDKSLTISSRTNKQKNLKEKSIRKKNNKGTELEEKTPRQKRKLENIHASTSSKRIKQNQTFTGDENITAAEDSSKSLLGQRSTYDCVSMATSSAGLNSIIEENRDKRGSPEVNTKGIIKCVSEKGGNSFMDNLGSNMKLLKQNKGRVKEKGGKKRKINDGSGLGKRRVSPQDTSHNTSVDGADRSDIADRSDVSETDIASVYMEQLSSLEQEYSSDGGTPSNQDPSSVLDNCTANYVSSKSRHTASSHSPTLTNGKTTITKSKRTTSHKHRLLDNCPNPSESSEDDCGLGNDGQDTLSSGGTVDEARSHEIHVGDDGMPLDDSEINDLETVYLEQLISVGN